MRGLEQKQLTHRPQKLKKNHREWHLLSEMRPGKKKGEAINQYQALHLKVMEREQ